MHKVFNFVWYLGRGLWFPFPWIFFVFYGIYKSKKTNICLLENRFFKFCLFGSTLIILWFSLFDRKADRYIFSAYCLLAVSGIWALIQIKPKMLHILNKKKKLLPIYLSLGLIIFSLIRICLHIYHYRFIRFWPG